MATPCIVAVGTRDAWRGVPCKMDGTPSWAGSVIVDRIVRTGSVDTAAEQLVRTARYGWNSVGATPLAEPDDYLGGTELTETTAREVLDRHHAIYVLDPTSSRLDVHAKDRWLEPAAFGPTGAIGSLPPWYPQLGERAAARRRRPEAITKQLQAHCLAIDVRWSVLTEALRRWVTRQLGDLAGCEWLYLGGEPDADHVRCLIDDTYVYAAADACFPWFTGADGRMRGFDVDDVELAETIFHELGMRRSHAVPVLETWLSLAYAIGSGQSGTSVSRSKRWTFYAPGHYATIDPIPHGWLPTLLSWLF